ncbi:unnamed protein product [Mucor fragilis]
MTMYLKPTSIHIIPIHSHNLRGQEPQSLSVNKHVFCGKNSNKRIAFLFSHATGYHKETFHPIMKRFKDQLRSQREYDQTDITFISWDDRHHGDSARLNEGCLSGNYSLMDSAMDTKQVVDFFGLKASYDHFIGVGHSLGSCTLLLCEHYYPGTFDGIFMAEPLMRASMEEAISVSKAVVNSFQARAEEWKEAEGFRELLLSKKVYKAFHPEVFELYASYGIYETDNHTFKLKCSRRSEEIMFRNSFIDCYICTKAIGELTIPTQFLLAKSSAFSASESWKIISKFSSNNHLRLDVSAGTHLIPFEHPDAIIPYLMDLTSRVARNKKQAFNAML